MEGQPDWAPREGLSRLANGLEGGDDDALRGLEEVARSGVDEVSVGGAGGPGAADDRADAVGAGGEVDGGIGAIRVGGGTAREREGVVGVAVEVGELGVAVEGDADGGVDNALGTGVRAVRVAAVTDGAGDGAVGVVDAACKADSRGIVRQAPSLTVLAPSRMKPSAFLRSAGVKRPYSHVSRQRDSRPETLMATRVLVGSSTAVS